MGPIVFHALFSLVQGMNIGFRPYAFGPVDGTGQVGSRVLEGVILHGSFRPVPCFQYGKPRKGGFSVNTSISAPRDGTLPFPTMRMYTDGPPSIEQRGGPRVPRLHPQTIAPHNGEEDRLGGCVDGARVAHVGEAACIVWLSLVAIPTDGHRVGSRRRRGLPRRGLLPGRLGGRRSCYHW